MISVIKTKISWLPKSKSEAPGADGLYWSAALQTQNGHSADQSEPRYIALASDTTENINKLIDKMSLGAGALNVKRPVAQKGSMALEEAMATKRAPTTRHRHTERVPWNNYHHPYLPIGGW